MQRRKNIKIITRLIAIFISLLLITTLLVQLPAVQTWLVKKTTNSLSKTLQTKVAIGQVNLRFFKTAQLEDIYIEDQQGDTLIFAKTVNASINLFSLWNKQVYLQDIRLEDAYFNFYKEDSIFNYTFLLDAFSSDSSSETSVNAPWDIDLKELAINNLRLAWQDKNPSADIQIGLYGLDVKLNDLDIPQQLVDFQQIELNQSKVIIKQSATTKTESGQIIFPQIPWAIKVGALVGKDNLLIVETGANSKTKNIFNPQQLHLEQLQFQVNDFSWVAQQIKGQINQIAFKDRGGLTIQNFRTNFVLDSTQIAFDKLFLQTPFSQLNNQIKLSFSQFSDLGNFSEKVFLTSNFSKTSIAFKDIRLFRTLIGNGIDFTKTENKKLQISGDFTGTLNELQAKNFALNIGKDLNLAADFAFRGLTTSSNPFFNVELKELSTSYTALSNLLPSVTLPLDLANFGRVQLKTTATGKVNDFSFIDLQLLSESNTNFNGNGQITGLPNPDSLWLDLNITQLQTSSEDLKGFIPASLTARFDSLQTISYQGKFKGTAKDFLLKGDLQTAIGNLNSNIQLSFNNDYTFAVYDGKLELDTFDLGKFLANEQEFGLVSLVAKGQGRGLTLDELDSDIKGTIHLLDYKSHRYKQIKLAGHFHQQEFDGTMTITDKNAAFNFDGKVNLNEELPEFKMTLNLDTLNLQALNLSQAKLNIKGLATLNFKGNHLDNLIGSLLLTNFQLENDSLHFYGDSLNLVSRQLAANTKELAISSDFLQAKMEGDYLLSELPLLLGQYLNQYFTGLSEFLPLDSLDTISTLSHPNFKLAFTLNDATPLTILALPELQALESTSTFLEYNANEGRLKLNSQLQGLTYANIHLESATLDLDGDAQSVQSKLSLTDFTNGQLGYPQSNLTATIRNDSMLMALELADSNAQKIVYSSGVLSQNNPYYQFHFDPNFTLNGIDWLIDQQNTILFKKDWLYVSKLMFQHQNQQLAFNSKDSIGQELSPLQINFQQFPISEVAEFLGYPKDYLEGQINGQLVLNRFFDELGFNTDARIDDLTFNQKAVGNLQLQAKQPSLSKTIDLNLGLNGVNQLQAAGTYTTDSQLFDLSAQIDSLSMYLLDPFMEGLISKSEGWLKGQFTFDGTIDKPNIVGNIRLNKVTTLIDFTQVRYAIGEGFIEFNSQEIDLNTINLKDKENRVASVNGKIYHQNFSDFQLDLNTKTNNFLFLNTTAENNELFYGKLLLKADIDIKGQPVSPILDINATTLATSTFTMSPFVEGEVVVQDDFIIFGHPDDFQNQEQDSLIYRLKNTYPFTVNLNLGLTDEAELQIIIDPETGDKLVCRGNSNLAISMQPSGEMSLFGNYLVESGAYSFSYGPAIQRKFAIKKGSSMNFNGDPLKASFDITAGYTAKTTTYELIRNETTLSKQEITAAQKRNEVEVLLAMKGNLLQPKVTFDIQLPSDESNSITSTVKRKLATLRTNPTELNQQVFGLLLANSFILAESSTETFASKGESFALSSVGKLFSNQLNKLADRYLKGVELSVGIDYYKSKYYEGAEGRTVAEVELGVSKQLFDEKLTFKAGGNVNLNTKGKETGFTSLAGDFLLEYRVADDGSLILRAFRQSEFDILDEANAVKNGVSVFFTKKIEQKSSN